MCKVYAGYHGTSEIGHGLCASMIDNPRANFYFSSQLSCLVPQSTDIQSLARDTP